MYDYPEYFLDVPEKVSFKFRLFLDKVYTHIICPLLAEASFSWYLPTKYQEKEVSANREYLKYIFF